MKHIAIIGAGISGLVTAKVFLQKGYHVTVFEKAADLGGVWESSRSYHGVTTQTTRDEYAFSDFPMPKDYPLWPSGAQVQSYLKNYATFFKVIPCIRFKTVVNNLDYQNGSWEITYTDLTTFNELQSVFDFVAVCTGTFHKPYVPEFSGHREFLKAGGQILHSSQVKDASMLKGKKVAVLGFAKSATDIATLAADVSENCTLIYRKAQWKVPRYFGNKINMRYLLFSRLSEAFFNSPQKTTGQRLLHSMGRPLVWMQWRALEALLKMQFSLKACDMIPKHHIEDQISCSLGVAPVGFYEKVKKGAVRAQRTEIAGFEGRGIVLANGEKIEADILVCGTGFTQELPFLENTWREKIIQNNAYHLYRNIVHPDVPAMGFIGYNSSLFTTLTSEVAAHWLACHAEGELRPADRQEMYKEMEYMYHWRKNARPVSAEFSGTCVAPFNYMHLDMLMKDMGLRTKLTRWPHEYLKPINPADYRRLLRPVAGYTWNPKSIKRPAPRVQQTAEIF